MARLHLYLRLALASVLALIASACQSLEVLERGDAPQLNFETFRYSLGKGDLALTLSLEQPATHELRIPFALAGTAREGEDYSIASREFVFATGQTTASVSITRKNMDKASSIFVRLSGTAPEGYIYGLKNYTQVELLGSDALIYSFAKAQDVLSYEQSYEMTVGKVTGETYRSAGQAKYALELDPTSTAVLGKHFEFVGSAEAVVPNRRNTGTFKLRFLSLEAGHETIVLRFADRDGYARGTNPTLTLRITGPDNFAGSWSLLKLANKDWINSSYGGFGVSADALVSVSDGDYMELSGNSYESYTLTPHFGGMLRNYFTKATTATFKGAVDKILSETSSGRPPTINLTKLQLGEVNVRFSATETLLKPANIGLRFITTESDGRLLEMTIDEYEPLQSGWKDVYDFSNNMTDLPLRLYFRPRP